MQLPINSAALLTIATGKVRPVREYAQLTDGQRRAIPDSHATNDAGVPMWQVDVMVDDDESNENGRSEVSSVKVPSKDQPQVAKFLPVQFEGMIAKPYVSGGWVAISYSASGIVSAQVNARTAKSAE